MRTQPGARRRVARWGALAAAVALAAAGGTAPAIAAPASGGGHGGGTATPIKHLVVIYDENNSFDHYFGTYPKATNTDGTKFTAAKHTPKANNLITPDHGPNLLTHNPNEYAPQRLTPAQAVTCDQNHSYGPEQKAYNGGAADQFVQNTTVSTCTGGPYQSPGLGMDYYDGNTVTALWNYAQHFALSDNSYGSAYGPSTPGALELVSGQTHGVISVDPTTGTENPKQTTTPDSYTVVSPDAQGVGTVVNDPDPGFDDCADTDHTGKNALAVMQGKNIGDLLNAKGVSWGWFQGGFTPSTPWDGKSTDYAKCAGDTHANVNGAASEDYSPHHDPFEYYKSTANPHHLLPTSLNEVGHSGQANHQYDLSYFDQAVKADKLPAVSFLKAAEYQDGHAGYSDPIDEQNFLIRTINELQQSKQWQDTAVVIAYDDSDGWYDHVMSPVLNGSKDSALDSPACQAGPAPVGGYADRCGPGPRQPLLVISPYSKSNAIDHTPTEQASITQFIENNWGTGRIGDASFDKRAGTLDNMFDFRHPNDQQVLLNANGSVASVKPIHKVSDPDAGDQTTGNAPTTDGVATEQLAETGASAVMPLTIAGVAIIAAGGAIAFVMRRRRTTA